MDGCLVLARRHEVTVLVPEGPRAPNELIVDLTAILGTDLSALQFVALGPGEAPSHALRSFDATFSVTNYWPMIGVPHPHVAVLQFPFEVTKWRLRRRVRSAIAFWRCDCLLVYSDYVRRWARTIPGTQPLVVAPGVVPVPSDSHTKERIILAVGRFTAAGHGKKHGVMIETFRDHVAPILPGWRLVLVGGAGPDDQGYLAKMRQLASGAAIDFYPNASRAELERFYRGASFLWHAAGFGEDELRNPELMEHFGIVAVEAMSAGAVPMVFAGGGLSEIVRDGVDGVVWTSLKELIGWTLSLAGDDERRQAMAARAEERAAVYSPETFCRAFENAMPVALR